MAHTESVAHPAHDSRSERLTREARALLLFEEQGDDIQHIADVYRVPSCSGSGSYDVLYGEREECPCPDYQFGGGRPCKHLIAVGVMHATRRSGVTVRTIPATIGGDPFAHAGKRRGCSLCFGGYVTITIEEGGREHEEAVSCRRCNHQERR
jgi:hypothetical protein